MIRQMCDDQGATQCKAKRFEDGPIYETRSPLRTGDDGYVNSHKIDKETVFISLPGLKNMLCLGSEFVFRIYRSSGFIMELFWRSM